jgi:hypothetical protein
MDDLIRFLGIDARAKQYAKLVWPLIQDHADGVVENFYVEAGKSDIGHVLDAEMIGRLKLKQKEHWRALFNSEFDQQYFNRASLVGIKHREIGLDPKWYIAGYSKIKGQFVTLILDAPLSTSTKSDLVATLDKYVALDMAIALSSYSSWLVD